MPKGRVEATKGFTTAATTIRVTLLMTIIIYSGRMFFVHKRRREKIKAYGRRDKIDRYRNRGEREREWLALFFFLHLQVPFFLLSFFFFLLLLSSSFSLLPFFFFFSACESSQALGSGQVIFHPCSFCILYIALLG